MSPTKEETHCDNDVPILIVGAGPCGLLLAYLLAQLGGMGPALHDIGNWSREKLQAPKAHALSPRTLELCRQYGLDVNEIRSIGTKRGEAFWVNFITNLSGRQVGRLPYERMVLDVLESTPTMIHNIPQPEFEELVAKRLSKNNLVEIRKNHSFVRLTDHGDYVLAAIEDRATQQEYTVKCSHLVACDGAKSAVRRCLGIESEGEDSYETMMTIHINADLHPVVKERVGMLHWVMDPEVSGFIIGYDLGGNQVLICNFDAKKHPVNSWDEALCRKVVDAAIGAKIPYDVLSYRPWILSRKVAIAYRANRVLLAGDAAHSFPPTGGLGLNSGLGDVHNLAYKLAAVHHGWGGDKLLDSYEADRRPVACDNAEQSVKNGKQIFGLLKALGTTDPDVHVARQNLYRNIEDAQMMKEINKGIEGQREHFDNLGLHVGYVYGNHKRPDCASTYEPVCIPGARLPHAWIKLLTPDQIRLPPIDCSYVSEFLPEELKLKQFSTLDLCAFDAFTLIVDIRSADHWGKILDDVKRQLPGKCSGLKLQMMTRGANFDLQPGGGEKWMALTRLAEGQAILVRPDQHVLARFEYPGESSGVLGELRAHLAWDEGEGGSG